MFKRKRPLYSSPVDTMQPIVPNNSPDKKRTRRDNIKYKRKTEPEIMPQPEIIPQANIIAPTRSDIIKYNYDEYSIKTFLKTQYLTIQLNNIITSELKKLFHIKLNKPKATSYTEKRKTSKRRSTYKKKKSLPISAPANLENVNYNIASQKSFNQNENNSSYVPMEQDSNNQNNNNIMKGGSQSECESLISWCLEYGIPDTLHDFGKSRNSIFPSAGKGYQGKIFSNIFLDKTKEFLQPIYQTKFQDTSPDKVLMKDPLYSIYSNNPYDFEEDSKTQYLLGLLCKEKVDNIQYYFTNAAIPETWSKEKKEFFGRDDNIPKEDGPTFYNMVKDYQYYIFDACLFIYKEADFKKTGIDKINTLSNLWDPLGSTKYAKTDIWDGNDNGIRLGLSFEIEMIQGQTICNSVYTKNGSKKSFYDETYDMFLNKNCLETYGIQIKLRLKEYIENNDSFYKIVMIFTKPDGSRYNDGMFDIDGGFSVSVLSNGLLYIEKDYNNTEPQNIKKDDPFMKLKEIINFVRDILRNSIGDESIVKNLLYVMITRFKSTGDHGTANATKILNNELEKSTLYLTGDQLAYVYSITNEIPTLFRFYNGKGSSDDDNDKDSCDIERVHFVGLYTGNTNEFNLLKQKYTYIESFFGDSNFNVFTEGDMNISISEKVRILMDTNLNLKNAFKIIFNNIETQTPDRQNKQNIQTILSNIPKSIFINDIETTIDNMQNLDPNYSKESIAEIKTYIDKLKELRSYFFMEKHFESYKENLLLKVKEQIEDYKRIVKINTDDILNKNKTEGRSRREDFGYIFEFGLSGFFNMFKNKNLDQFVEMTKKMQVDERETKKGQINVSFLDKIIDVKKNMELRFIKMQSYVENELFVSSETFKEYTHIIFEQYKQILREKTRVIKKTENTVVEHVMTLFFDTPLSNLEKYGTKKEEAKLEADKKKQEKELLKEQLKATKKLEKELKEQIKLTNASKKPKSTTKKIQKALSKVVSIFTGQKNNEQQGGKTMKRYNR